ncbi:MAG: hypothetical protein PHQ74_09955 [Crocinitomicaceae bacterium]|nr:hypothetical protein [Crocinitomicaceae bacterium]
MKISYLIGLPLGLFAIFSALLFPTMGSGESLAGFILNESYGIASIGLFISFVIALGIAGRSASVNIAKQKSVLETSFRYTITVNAIIWSVFILLTIISNDQKDLWFLLIPPFIAFLISTFVTAFTFGLLISYLIKTKHIKKRFY